MLQILGDAVAAETFQRGEGGAAFGSNFVLQSAEVFAGLLGQGDGAFEGGQAQSACLLRVEAEILRRLLQGVEQVEDVGGAAAADAGNGVHLFFGIEPEGSAAAAHDGFGAAAVVFAGAAAGKQAGDAFADLGGGVGHYAHDALCAAEIAR